MISSSSYLPSPPSIPSDTFAIDRFFDSHFSYSPISLFFIISSRAKFLLLHLNLRIEMAQTSKGKNEYVVLFLINSYLFELAESLQ